MVADGVMYLSTPNNDVVANRGVSLGYGAVYMASADARLIKLDMETGSVI